VHLGGRLNSGPERPGDSSGAASGPGRSRWRALAPYLVGFGLLSVVLATSDLRGLAATLARTRWGWYLAAQLVMVSYITVHVWRWDYLLRLQSIVYPFPRVFCMFNAGSLAGTVTPGRLGDFARLIYFSRSGHSLVTATLSIIVDRFLDVLFLSLVAVLSALFFPLPRILKDGVLTLAAAGLVVSLAIGLVAWRTRGWQWFGAVVARIVPRWLQSGWPQRLADLQEAFQRYLTWRLGWSLVLTLMAWNINFFGSFLIARSLDLPVTFWEVGALIGLSTIFTLLPVSIAGLGTREVSLIFLFSCLGLSQEQALAFSLLLLGLVVVHAAIGWLSLILHPPAIRPRDLRFQGEGR
jgi:uncharacterized protein (TIRG00374 family)